jgi:hypothetical protein
MTIININIIAIAASIANRKEEKRIDEVREKRFTLLLRFFSLMRCKCRGAKESSIRFP